MKATAFIWRGGEFDPNSLLAAIDGVVTDEHAASSYGQPVFVADDGQVYGPADIAALGDTDHRVFLPADRGAEPEECLEALRSAGYNAAYAYRD